MIDHYEEEQYLADVIIYRYWLHWEDYETNTGATIAYFETKQEGRDYMSGCISENPHVYYYLEDLETGEEITHYDPTDY